MKKAKNTKRFILKLLIACVILGAAATLTVNLIVCGSTSARIYEPDAPELSDFTDADCILVLGARVRSDGTPSDMLADRLSVGVGLFGLPLSDTILMSGDHGRKEYDEVNCMKSYALEAGLPEDRIFLDHAGFSTYESLYRAKEIFGAEKLVIVTQKYHLYRALYIADALGLDAVGVSADVRTYRGQLKRDVREAAARVKDFLTSAFQPLPTYLGEPISLEGSGTVTDG